MRTMKVAQQIRKLLKEGRSRKELVELGLPKAWITRVSRQERAQEREAKAASTDAASANKRRKPSRGQTMAQLAKELAQIGAIAHNAMATADLLWLQNHGRMHLKYPDFSDHTHPFEELIAVEREARARMQETQQRLAESSGTESG